MLGFLAQSLKATMCPEKYSKHTTRYSTVSDVTEGHPQEGRAHSSGLRKGHIAGVTISSHDCVFPKCPSLSSSLGSLWRPTPLYCVLLSTRLPLTPLSDLVSDPLTWEWKYLTTCSRVLFPAFSGPESLVSVSHTCILQCSSLENICTPVIWLTFPHKHGFV